MPKPTTPTGNTDADPTGASDDGSVPGEHVTAVTIGGAGPARVETSAGRVLLSTGDGLAALPTAGHTQACIRTAERIAEESLTVLPHGAEAIIPDYYAPPTDPAGTWRRTEQLRRLALRYLSEGDAMCSCPPADCPPADVGASRQTWRGWVHEGAGEPWLASVTGTTLPGALLPLLTDHPRAEVEVCELAGRGSRPDQGVSPRRWFRLRVTEVPEVPTATEHPGPVEALTARMTMASDGTCADCRRPLARCWCGPAVEVDQLAQVRTELLGACYRAHQAGQAEVAEQLRDAIGALVDAEAAARRTGGQA